MVRAEPHRSFFNRDTPGHPADDRYRAIVELALDALIVFDDDGCCVEANAAAAALIGAPADEIVGRRLDRFISLPAAENEAEAFVLWAGLLAPGHQFRHCVALRADGARRMASCRLNLHFVPGFNLCQMRDDSDLKQVEDSYRTLVEITHTGYAILDPDGRLVDANAEYVRLSGHTALAQVAGRCCLEWTALADRARCAARLAACGAGESVRDLEIDYRHASGRLQPVELNASAIDTPDGVRVLALCRDISDRRQVQQVLRAAHDALEDRVRERTAELAQANSENHSRALRQEIVANFGHHALMGASADTLMREAVETIARTLGVELCEVLELKRPAPGDPSGPDDLVMRAGFGWPSDRFDQRVSNSEANTLEGAVLRGHDALVFEDLAAETRFEPPARLLALGAVSGLCTVVNGEAQPFGVLSVHSCKRRPFNSDDLYFVQSIANVLAEALERQQAEDTVRKAQREAMQANNAKNEFLSRMSHELRTPLNAILGFSQLLEIEELGASQRESVDQIIRAGGHLLDMVNEVMDIARIEAGNLALSTEAISLRQLVRETSDLIRPLTGEHLISITLLPELAESAHCVLADRQRLRQVVLNLLSNAVKFNREGGRITVGLGTSSRAGFLRLEVADTGIGISAEKASRLFTPFDRLGAENTAVEGDGIGLALSKRLMAAQGGELGYDQQADGSRFWIELPCAEAPALEKLPLDVIHTLFDETAPELPDPATPPGNPRTVLHIEDNESNRLLVEMLFVQRPFLNLVSAARGQEGLKLALDRRPDLILLDMHLPDTSGEEVLHSLRADDRTRGTPVVVISADASGPRIRHLREAGADDYLTKPFNVGQFFRMLDEHLVEAH